MIQFEELRRREFSRLDLAGDVYLDYTGSGLYPESLIRTHAALLTSSTFGNPHSRNPTSSAAAELVQRTRDRVHRFFRANPAEYEVIFTANSTAALKLVGEAFPFDRGSRLVMTADNHNSALGIREFARAREASVRYVPLDTELRAAELERTLAGADRARRNLFVFPAQSNFSGVRHPLEWIGLARDAGYDVLLDAAAFVPTSALDLSVYHPDFVCVSFYKMFGFPTGVGALIARREALTRLRRPWFAGGTVRYSSMQNEVHIPYRGAAAFEEGTANFLSLPAVIDGLDFLEEIGMNAITEHVSTLTQRLLVMMAGLPNVRVYGPLNMTDRGGCIAFNVKDIDTRLVEQLAAQSGISLRTGRFCNPGAAEFAFEYPQQQAEDCFHECYGDDFSLDRFSLCMNGRPAGAVRVSVGVASNHADVDRFIEFLSQIAPNQGNNRLPSNAANAFEVGVVPS